MSTQSAILLASPPGSRRLLQAPGARNFDLAGQNMYEYRNWTPQRRAEIVADRVNRGYPWHSPPHFDAPGEYRIVTGTCFEHRKILETSARLGWFEEQLLATIREQECPCAAWVVLPNHYHVVTKIADMDQFARALGQLHGRTSFEMNREDDARGRQVWYRVQDRCMRSEAHLYTTLNYLHNNPVKHGYVTKWTDWPFSSVHWYLQRRGREWMTDLWLRYPVLKYGEKWDL